MEDKGVVKNIQDGIAVVQITTTPSGCASCSLRNICNPSGGMKEIQAQNKVGARIGDEVIVFIPEGIGWMAMFVNFTVPVLLLIIGIIIGKIMFGKDIYSFFTGIGLTGIYALILVIVDKRKKGKGFLPYIKEVVNPSTE